MNYIEEVRLFSAGSCKQKEALSICGGRWRDIEFPATCALFSHPEFGWVLYDTGYDPEITSVGARFSMRAYAKFFKVVSNRQTSVVSRLGELGIDPDEISFVILSHFHPDHIGGVRFFRSARFLCSRTGYEKVCRQPKRLGFNRELLPKDFEQRCKFVENRPLVREKSLSCFGSVFDLFGDGSVFSVLIDGHAPRQVACLIRGAERSCFLVADSAWSRRAIFERRLPHWLTYFVQDDWKSLVDNLGSLSRLARENPLWIFLPTHCQASLAEGFFTLAQK